MRILGIVGSNVVSGANKPIATGDGSFERTAVDCLALLAREGHQTENVFLREANIEFCDHCEICDHEELCNKTDDFWPVYEKMKSADAIILFTPVTFAVMNPKLSALLQRAGRIAKRHGSKFSGKFSGAITEEFTEGGDYVLAQLRIWYQMMKMLIPAESRIMVGRRADGRHEGSGAMNLKRTESARELSRKLIDAIHKQACSSKVAG